MKLAKFSATQGARLRRIDVKNSISLILLLISCPLFADGNGSSRQTQSTHKITSATIESLPASEAPAINRARHLRQMQIYTVPELGLKIWVENQPPWEAQVIKERRQPIFVAQSPDYYQPPVAMTYTSFPKEIIADAEMSLTASTAIERASQNFGLSSGKAKNLSKYKAQYGNLIGLESTFLGRVDGVAVDVKVFVGQQSGKFPVALSVYTIKGKLPLLNEVIRRSWGNLAYMQ